MRILVVAALILLMVPGCQAAGYQFAPTPGHLIPCIPVGAGIDLDEPPFVHPIIRHECIGGSPSEEEASAPASDNETEDNA